MIDRRSFLTGGLLLAGSTFAGLKRAEAQAMSQDALLVVFLEGGWDTVLGGDPRGAMQNQAARDRMAQYPASAVRPFAGQAIGVGPSLASFASRFADDLVIVRGVNMGVDGHEFAQHHWAYGTQLFSLYPSDQDTLQAAWVRSQLSNAPLANLSLGIAGLNSARSSTPGPATPIFIPPDGLQALFTQDYRLRLAPATKDLIEAQIRARTRPRRAAILDRASAIGRQGLGSLVTLDPLIQTLGRTRGDLSDFDVQCLMAFQLIKNRLSSCITIGLPGFDTHQTYEYQAHLDLWTSIFGGDPSRFNGLTGLSLLIWLLKNNPGADGRPLLDHTTVVISSEFSRIDRQTAHNPANNNYLLMGKGFRKQPGGRIFGASDEETATALPIDLTTGRPNPTGGTVLTPGHLFDTILAAGGIAAPRAIPALLG